MFAVLRKKFKIFDEKLQLYFTFIHVPSQNNDKGKVTNEKYFVKLTKQRVTRLNQVQTLTVITSLIQYFKIYQMNKMLIQLNKMFIQMNRMFIKLNEPIAHFNEHNV